jgi:protein TonB
MKGQEGWVLLEFDITEVGTVDNVKVIESEPRRVFDSSARRALLKWKYKPK